MIPQRSVRLVWMREAAFVAAALAFAAATVWLGRTLPQFNDAESVQTLNEASAIGAGFHRWGLLEYTHHPLGRTYLLLPFVYAGCQACISYVPVVIAALCGGLALWALLRRAPTGLLRLAILGMFAALLAQPGYTHWIGNLHQHSYNMSAVLLLIFLGVRIERARWLALTGLFCGWVGYDFFFAQVGTVLAVRLGFWNRRRDAGPSEQLLAACGDTAAFLIGVFSATLLHYAQNVLYFSSATMAYNDLFGSLAFRTSVRPQAVTRLQDVASLVRIYVRLFFAPDGKWSNPASLAAASSLLAVGGLDRLRRLRAGLRPGWTMPLWNACVAVIVVTGGIAALLVWFYVAPRHAGPHLHLFPRLLLIPFVVATAGLVLVLSPASPGAVPSTRRSALCLAILPVLVAVNWFGPPWSAAAIDARFYDRTWIGISDAANAALMAAPLLPATAAASSTDPLLDLDAPLQVKTQVMMVGRIDNWGSDLDSNLKLRWAPAIAGPSWYEQRFGAVAHVTDVTIRVWGLPHARGAATPPSFVLAGVAPDGTLQAVRRYPDPGDPPVLQGKYIVFHYRFDPPMPSTALRLDFGRTFGGGRPALFDFQAFGT